MPIKLKGATSGDVTVSAPAVAGTTSLILPTDSVQPGLVLVATGSVSAGSAININNCFTATYDNYRVLLRSNVTCTWRWRAGGADNTSAVYYDQYLMASSTTVGAARASTATSHGMFSGSAVGSIEVYQPAAAVPTYAVLTRSEAGTGVTTLQYSYYHSASTAFDGFSVLGTSMTATVFVYGYRNSITT